MSKNLILEDCAKLLKNILDRNPNKDYIEAYIALMDSDVEGSKFLPLPIFGYKFPQTVIKFQAVGIFENVKKIFGFEKLQNIDQLEEALSEDLFDGVDELNNSRFYDARVYNDSAWRPGMPSPKKEGWEGLYKVNLVSKAAGNWLDTNGFSLSVTYERKQKLTKKWVNEQIKDLIKARNLGKKEAELLRQLSDLEKHETKKLKSSIPTADYKHLKGEVQKKIQSLLLPHQLYW